MIIYTPDHSVYLQVKEETESGQDVGERWVLTTILSDPITSRQR